MKISFNNLLEKFTEQAKKIDKLMEIIEKDEYIGEFLNGYMILNFLRHLREIKNHELTMIKIHNKTRPFRT